MTVSLTPVTRCDDLPQRRGSIGDRLLAVAICSGLVAVHAARYGQWVVDDAGLTFAYARSIANGTGPRLQAGAPAVEGFSNPAWTAVLVVGRWLHLFDHGTWFGVTDLVVFPKVVALLCFFGVLSCAYAIVADVRPEYALSITLAAGAATAAVPAFVIWTMSGLENSLLTLAVMGIAASLVRAVQRGRLLDSRTAILCGALAALAALTRPDGLVYVGAYPIAVLLLHRADRRRTVRMIATSCCTALIPLSLYVVMRLVVFGQWLANTAVAKRQGLPSLSDLNKPTDLFVYAGWMVSILAIGLMAATFLRPSTLRAPLTVLTILLGLATLAYTVLEADWMAELRFSTPVWPLLFLLIALASADVLSSAGRGARFAATAALLLTTVVTMNVWVQRSNAFVRRPTVSICAIARNTGYTFNTYADRLAIGEGSLLAVDGGGTALSSRLRFVDLSGLTDTRIADYWAHRDMAGLRDYVFGDVRPTFIRIWFGWDGIAPTKILEDERLGRDYVLIWSPPQGGGNWVRRDAVHDETALGNLQQAAPKLAEVVDAPYGRSTTRWWCDPKMRPSAVGDDPLTRLPG